MRFVTRAPRSLSLLLGGAFAVWIATLSPGVPVLPIAGAAGLAQANPQGAASAGRPLKVLFLGQDQATHPAAGIYQAIGPPLARKGIQLTAVLSPAALTAERLGYYDALIIYGNPASLTPEKDRLAPDQEKALMDFVEGGKGVVALHSASDMFAGSERYAALIGAQSQRQGTPSELTAEIVQPSHPAVQGIQPFASWDEAVVFTKQNATGRTVLMERVDPTGRTPWTWVRTRGQGARVLHRVGPRPADLEQSGLPDARRARRRLERARGGAAGVPATQDASGHLRRWHERAELREPRSRAQVPVALPIRTRR